jgi:hypothetical protein
MLLLLDLDGAVIGSVIEHVESVIETSVEVLLDPRRIASSYQSRRRSAPRKPTPALAGKPVASTHVYPPYHIYPLTYVKGCFLK